MRMRRVLGAAFVALLLAAAACGDDDTATDTTDATDDTAPAGSTVAVTASDTDFGEILVDTQGRTLYGFKNDADGVSNCSGTCAEQWPPLVVSDDWTVGPTLDAGIFNTWTRDDGTNQLVAGSWPLYTYSGDTGPGSVAGQGNGDVWFVVGTDGRLIEDAAGDAGAAAGDATVSVAETELGHVLVDADGLTLYGFTDDADGVPTCEGACADAWPPLTVDGEPTAGEGIEDGVLSTVDGPHGTQVVAGVWPLYTFSGDAAPGDTNGQDSGGVWFAVAPDGSLVQDGADGEGASAGGGSPNDAGY